MIGNRLIFATAACFLLMSSGCSILTKTQVKEVNRFATAAKEYGDMPGTVISEHARIRKVRQVLGAASDFDSDTALDAIKLALNQQQRLEARARQADAALKVLKDYADLLAQLASDEFTTQLQSSIESLGRSIDKGIRTYNRESGNDLGVFGSGVAAAVRGIGEVGVRREQEKALKAAITSADPIVRAMTWTVEHAMALYLDSGQLAQVKDLILEKGQPELSPGALLIMEKNAVMDKYRTTAGRFEGKQPPSLALTVAGEMQDADNAAALAVRTLVASQTYRIAHGKLVEMVLKKKHLPEMIDEVQLLVEEVNAARDVKKALEKKETGDEKCSMTQG